ncbi:MAG: (d)CMP kinase [Oscillospiraceae bacterium]|nr:(d)CMP kinase [Oscillospiraceae bacterium]
MKTYNIAIDGPSGAGKSSISRAVAEELGFIHADTGALYRAIGLYALRNECLEEEKITQEIDNIHVSLKFIGGVQRVILNDEDVTEYIRTPEVSMAASRVSAVGAVRALLLGLQKKIAAESNVIMDGRDIGMVVLPDADLKIFLTASAEERASRRYLELQEKDENCPPYERILEDIRQRDYNDSHRAIAPLRQAEDAVLVDSSHMGFNEVVEHVTALIRDTLGL